MQYYTTNVHTLSNSDALSAKVPFNKSNCFPRSDFIVAFAASSLSSSDTYQKETNAI